MQPLASPARWTQAGKLTEPLASARSDRSTSDSESPHTVAELEAIRRSVHGGQLYGSHAWLRSTAPTVELESTLRPGERANT